MHGGVCAPSRQERRCIMLDFLSKSGWSSCVSSIGRSGRSGRQTIEKCIFMFFGVSLAIFASWLALYFGYTAFVVQTFSSWLFLSIFLFGSLCASLFLISIAEQDSKEAEKNQKMANDVYEAHATTISELAVSEKERKVLRIVLSYTITQNLDELYSQFVLNMEIVPELRALGMLGLIDRLQQMLENEIASAKEKIVSHVESTEVTLLKAKRHYDKLIALRGKFKVEKQG